VKSNFLVVGLGNPGDNYKDTRHNIGFKVLDYVGNRFELQFLKKNNYKYSERYFICRVNRVNVIFLYPLTYMNNSGKALKNFCEEHKLNINKNIDLIVIHDDIDMNIGKVKIKRRSGHGGHNGIKSIINEIGTNDFIRIKIGIGKPVNKELIPEYVLSKFSKDEKTIIEKSIKKASNLLIRLFFNPLEKVQSTIIN
jgi:PTH1 family peptidyl-tRNA hydrolase